MLSNDIPVVPSAVNEVNLKMTVLPVKLLIDIVWVVYVVVVFVFVPKLTHVEPEFSEYSTVTIFLAAFNNPNLFRSKIKFAFGSLIV